MRKSMILSETTTEYVLPHKNSENTSSEISVGLEPSLEAGSLVC
jgi:hypothetical protein